MVRRAAQFELIIRYIENAKRALRLVNCEWALTERRYPHQRDHDVNLTIFEVYIAPCNCMQLLQRALLVPSIQLTEDS